MDGSSPLYYVLYTLCTVQYLRVKRDIGERDTEKGDHSEKKKADREERGWEKGWPGKKGEEIPHKTETPFSPVSPVRP
jgi:hypothetical protein